MAQVNNTSFLIGRLTKDPELRYTNQNNKAVASFTIAVDKYGANKDDKETAFIPIIAWEKLAEFCSNYLFKGKKVAVLGSLRTRNWDDDKGIKHYVTEVVAESIDFADDKKKDGQPQQEQSQQQQNTPPQQQQQQTWQQPQGQQTQTQQWQQQQFAPQNNNAMPPNNDNPWTQPQTPPQNTAAPVGQPNTTGKPPWAT